ncbi:MAG: hypothetical protein FWD35_05565 [Oscillospiraceae bacterium]|nr:hypothetical protein [Oscillospiraceae bacterium]
MDNQETNQKAQEVKETKNDRRASERANPTRRGYQRTDRFTIIGKARPASDVPVKGGWDSIDVLNMAAGGLLFIIEKAYSVGDVLEFELDIDTNVISRLENYQSIKINVKCRAVVKYHMGIQGDKNTYGAAITEMSQSDKIRLDELILSIEQFGGIT